MAPGDSGDPVETSDSRTASASGARTPTASGAPIVVADRCSKWYGHVLGISDVSFELTGGVIGLLGPNGAGKSTLIKLMAGLLRPSQGRLTLFGDLPFDAADVRRRIGYCPEHEGMYDQLTALEHVELMAELSGVPAARARDAAAAALSGVGMDEAKDRRVRGFSKGMRQRTKLAQALVHAPELILLDEPLTGVDPLARADISRRVRELGDAGVTVIVSSHVLYEIESLTTDILVLYRGQVLAEGNIYKIRELIDHHPHRIRVECDRPREFGRALAEAEHVRKLSFDRDAVTVETVDPDHCYDLIARAVLERDIAVCSLTSPDNNLSAVFDYLTGGSAP